jgi:hypothetical protein
MSLPWHQVVPAASSCHIESLAQTEDIVCSAHALHQVVKDVVVIEDQVVGARLDSLSAQAPLFAKMLLDLPTCDQP